MSTTALPGRVLRHSAAIGVFLAASCTDTDNERSLTAPVTPAADVGSSAYDVFKMSGPVTLDGNLSEWAGIPTITFQDDPSNGRGALNNAVTARMAWDATYLYVAYDVSDTELWAAETARDAPNLYRDDEVELYIDPQADGGTWMKATDYQLLANVRDAVKDANGDGAGGKPSGFNAQSLQAKAALNGSLNDGTSSDAGYTIELRVAWSDLGGTVPAGGKLMRLDLAVGDKDSASQTVVQSFDWAALATTYNNPDGWKDVQLVDSPPFVPVYDIVKVASSTLTLDGNLSDWAGVSAIPTFADDAARGAAANSASVRMAWDDTYLYAAYTITDTELLASETVRDAPNLYRDDEVELFLDPQGDGGTWMKATDYQLLANVRDAVKDANGDGAGGKLSGFNAQSLQAKAALNGSLNGGSADVGYTIELRVAWSDLGSTVPAAGKLMRLDLAVGDKDSGIQSVESFDWAGLTTTYNNPDGWKGVRLVVDATPPAAPTNPALTVVSSSAITLSWTPSSSPDVARYRVYRGTTSSPTLLTTVAGSPFSNTGLQPSTTYTYQVSAVDAAGNESARTTPVSATTQGIRGIPYGPFALWTGSTTVAWGPEPFTTSQNFSDPSTLVTQINAARSMHQSLVLAMTGGAHSATNLGCCLSIVDGVAKFDMAKWKARMEKFNTAAIKQAVDSGVKDGTVVGNTLMDEPEVTGGGDGNTWGPTGWMTKAKVNEMARYARAIFPTLPMGVNHGPTGYQWRTTEQYTDVDYVVNQYNWWVTSGNVAAWRDNVLARAAADGVTPGFSLNILNGGVQDRDGTYSCDGTGQAGKGTYSPNCRMTATQVRDWGRTLGVAGCVMFMWKYDDAFMARLDNQQSFDDVAATLAAASPRSCRRPT
jgi:hypothetical protein